MRQGWAHERGRSKSQAARAPARMSGRIRRWWGLAARRLRRSRRGNPAARASARRGWNPHPARRPLGRSAAPVPGPAGWGEARLRFWRSEVWPELPLEEMPGDLLAQAHDLRHASGVVLWVGGALSDQLLLPSTDRIAQLAGAPDVTIAVVPFTGTGPPVPVGPQARTLLRRIWEGITADEPMSLLAAIELAGEAFPELQRALGFFLTKYPDARSGLSRWDQELLRQAPGTGAQRGARAPGQRRVPRSRGGPGAPRAPGPRSPIPRFPGHRHPASGDTLVSALGEDVLAGGKLRGPGIDEWIAACNCTRRRPRLVPPRATSSCRRGPTWSRSRLTSGRRTRRRGGDSPPRGLIAWARLAVFAPGAPPPSR